MGAFQPFTVGPASGGVEEFYCSEAEVLPLSVGGKHQRVSLEVARQWRKRDPSRVPIPVFCAACRKTIWDVREFEES